MFLSFSAQVVKNTAIDAGVVGDESVGMAPSLDGDLRLSGFAQGLMRLCLAPPVVPARAERFEKGLFVCVSPQFGKEMAEGDTGAAGRQGDVVPV